jgi:diadenosine tetraphosphatase ApaH/serine/threonine PP2A family protein phosphatase
MLTALFADIHANREAFSACLADATARGARQYILLGDYVGYGADPEWVLNTVMAQVSAGAIALRGNHDAAVLDESEQLNEMARAAMVWTRGRVTEPQRNFLRSLPLAHADGDRLFVHASAASPDKWHYVSSQAAALRSFRATSHRVTFCGHVHLPQVYHLSLTGKVGAFTPAEDTAIPLIPQRRWLIVVGSVGQPRDGAPGAAYALLDPETATVMYLRVGYEVEQAAAKIRAAGLPEILSIRLLKGY